MKVNCRLETFTVDRAVLDKKYATNLKSIRRLVFELCVMKVGDNAASIRPRHSCDVIDTAIGWEEVGERCFFELFRISGHFQVAWFSEAFAGPFYASCDDY